mmetsp:Transcript_3649/g.4822  ORF Transcript_3649/g.4822 Transcript_3649/m.4822 type:complete len:106 (+) Transcript_3649:111-428(+)
MMAALFNASQSYLSQPDSSSTDISLFFKGSKSDDAQPPIAPPPCSFTLRWNREHRNCSANVNFNFYCMNRIHQVPKYNSKYCKIIDPDNNRSYEEAGAWVSFNND